MKLFTDNPDFYPTPEAVIEKMMFGEDFVGKTVLEPSAGNGNIVDWLKTHGSCNVIACENDPNIRKLLNGKCEIIADDFLTVTSDMVSHVHHIVMNPPFSKGVEHILHAFDIAPAGCVITALCNYDSIKYEHHNKKNRELAELVEMCGRQEYLGSVFDDDAERKTRCSITMLKLYKYGDGEDEFSGYFFSEYDEDVANANEKEGIMPYNFIREIVNRYVSAIKLFDDTLEATKRLNDAATYVEYRQEKDGNGNLIQKKHEYGYLPIRFKAVSIDERATEVTHASYRKALQKYYWGIIFSKLKMHKYATKKLDEDINKFIENNQHIPFTMANIYRVLDIVIQTNGQRMQKALEEAFDTICSFSAENSGAGEKWKTNANYMVNRKFIVPYMTEYASYGFKNKYVELSHYGKTREIEDVCKALCYITGIDYDNVDSLSDVVRSSRFSGIEWGEWFRWGFFRCKAYKKGTMHFEFLDEDVWYMFNRRVAEARGWTLPKKTQKKK